MALATLTIDINAKLANIERDMGKVAHLSEQAAYRIQNAWKAAGSVFAMLGGGAIAGSLASLVKASIDANAALDDMAEKTGATVESLSAISDIAKIGGHDMGTLESGMVRLTKALAGGDDEAKAAGHALAQLGLKADELRKMDTGTAMLEVAKALDKYGDSGGKTALVMDLLGKNGAAMLPFLKDLAETGQLNAKVTAEQAAEAERLQKSWNQLKVYSDDLGRSLASAVVPALNDVIRNFNNAKEAGFGFFRSVTGIGVRGFFESVDDAKANSGARINELRKEIDSLSAERDRQLQFGATASADSLQVAIDNATKKMRYYQALQRDVLAERFSGGQYLDARDLRAAQKGDLSGYQPPSGPGSKGGKTKTQEIIDALGSGSYLTRDKATAQAIKESFDFENWAWGEIAKDRTEAAKAAEKYDEALRKAAESLYAATDAGKFEEMNRSLAKVKEAFDAGYLNEDQVAAIEDNLRLIKDTGKDAFAELTQAVDGWGKQAAYAFADFAASGMRSFSDLGSFADSIMRQMISMTTNELFFKPMFDDIKKMLPSGDAGGGNAWSWLKSLWPFEAGGIMSAAGPLPLQRYATGGIASSPQLALFGEGSMNEAFVPLPDGRRIPVQMRGGAQTIIVNVTSTTGDRAEIRRSAASGARAALGIMSGARRYG